MSFEQELNSALDKTLKYALTARNQGVLEIGSAIIRDTPKLTGALRGSWRSTLEAPSEDMSTRIDETEYGEAPKAELKAAIAAWPESGSLFLTNNQPYAEGVEFDGYSAQRPQGMVRVNIAGRTDIADLTAGTGRTE